MLLQTAHQVAKKSGSAHMKFISNGTASQARSLTIGSERNANSKMPLSSQETGIAFTTRIPPLRAPERAFRTRKTERDQGNDDTGDSGKSNRSGPCSCRGRRHSPIPQEQGADPTHHRQEVPPVGSHEK